MTSRNLVLVTDTRLDEHTFAAAAALLVGLQISTMSSRVAKIVEMLVSRSTIQKDELQKSKKSSK